MKSWALLIAFFLVVWLSAGMGSYALTLNISPSTMDWNSNGWVDIVISNITPGAMVRCNLLVDVDQNRLLSLPDRPLAGFEVRDGITNRFGGVYMPADRDGLANGVIVTRFSYHGLDSPLHTIGSYLWVALTNPAMPVAQSFSIIQDTSSVWITGFVRSYIPPNRPIGGARVQLGYFSLASGPEPAVWTDTNGAFRLYVPSGIGTGDVRGVFAAAPGYLGADQTPDGTWLSAYPFWQPLSMGENALTNSLFLVEPVPGALYAVSGRVVMVNGGITSPVPYTLIQAEPADDAGGSVWTVDVTKEDGSFRLVLPGQFEALILLSPNVNQRGLVATLQSVLVETQDIGGLEIQCFPARSLVGGLVESADHLTPVVGLPMFVYDEMNGTYGFAYTMGDGRFEIGALPGDQQFSGCLDEDAAWRLRYVPPEDQGPFSVEDGEVLMDLLYFSLQRAFAVNGRVFDVQTNVLQGGWVTAFPTGMMWESVADADVNMLGEYALLVPTGTYRLQADGFAGYLPMSWSNHFLWEWSNGPACDPLTVETSDVSGVNFYLHPAAYIRGVVRGDGVPLEGVEVRAMIGWEWRGSDFTDSNGMYELALLGRTSYVVEAQATGVTFWVHQYFSGALYVEDATPVYTEAGMPAESVDFDLVKGGRIEGQLLEPDGVSVFTSAMANVAGMDISNTWINSTMADQATGTFGVTLPAGSYRIRAEALGWLAQYYGGYFDYNWPAAPVVTVGVEQVAGGVVITMAPPSYVEGEVRSGGVPLTNIPVEVVWMFDTNFWTWNYIAGERTDAGGRYSIAVPPGDNFAVRVVPEGSTGYTEQWWSNAPNAQAATLLAVGRGVTVSNIHFDLTAGMQIMGRVTDEVGSPFTNALIEAWRIEDGAWYWAAQSYTDTNGNYVIAVPATTGYVVVLRRPWEAPVETWWYPTLFYSNTYFATNAQVLWTNGGSAVTNVDFEAHPGMQLTGMVVRAIGGDPIGDAEVQLFYSDVTHILDNVRSDSNGSYRACVPTNWALFAKCQAAGFGDRWYSNTYSQAEATPIWGSAYIRVNVPFALAAYGDDVDGDGFDEYAETRLLQTDPLDGNDYLRAAQAVRVGSNVEIQWMSRSGVEYWVQRTEDLKAGTWIEIAGPEVGTGGLMTVTDTNAPPAAVYRILVVGLGPG